MKSYGIRRSQASDKDYKTCSVIFYWLLEARLFMSIVAVSEKVEAIVSGLFQCTKAPQVKDVFFKNGITDPSEKIELLRKCMGVLDISNISEELSEEEEYADELEIFLDGTWRFLG